MYQNDELFIGNDGLCTDNDDFCTDNDELCTLTDELWQLRPELKQIEFEVTAATPARRDELIDALHTSAGGFGGLGLRRRAVAEQDVSTNPLTVPPQCKRNQLTLFVSSLCGAAPDAQAAWREEPWRAASADASEACFRQSLSVERELLSKKLVFTKVDLAQTEEQARRRLRRLAWSALTARVAELQHADKNRVRQVQKAIKKQRMGRAEKEEAVVALAASLEQLLVERAKLALKHKLGWGFKLPQLFCGLCRLPLEGETNDERAGVGPGRDSGYSHLWYCGRRLSPDKFDQSLTEGVCGPANGPQCKSCQRYQAAQSGGESIHALNLWAGHAKTDGAEIDWSDLKGDATGLLGKGTTGKVYKMKWMSAGGLLVAVKIFNARASGSEGPSQMEQFRNETQMLAGLRHAHVLGKHIDCLLKCLDFGLKCLDLY